MERQLLRHVIESLDYCLAQMMSSQPQLDVIVPRVESAISAVHQVLERSESTMWSTVLNRLETGIEMLMCTMEGHFLDVPKLGRPRIHVPVEKLEYFLSLNFKVPDIAAMLHVSRGTIFNRFNEYNISVAQTYSVISDESLNDLVMQKLLQFPSTGYKRMKGYLLASGVRVTDFRVREAMRIVDPEGVYQRTHACGPIERRRYKVPYSNYIWHVDGNHKLIRWKIVVRAGIDGMSRKIVYMAATGDNRADTHLEAFLGGVELNGVPLHCRTDKDKLLWFIIKGRENVLIAQYMIETRGVGRASHICGKSVHNQRIERLWRDVFYDCLGDYYNLFKRLEQNNILNIDNVKHLFALHRIFLPRLNRSLQIFIEGWNLHSLSSVHNYSPSQIFILHLHPQEYDVLPTLDMADLHDRDIFVDDMSQLDLLEEPILNWPIADSCVTNAELAVLDSINPFQNSDLFGYDLFVETMQRLAYVSRVENVDSY